MPGGLGSAALILTVGLLLPQGGQVRGRVVDAGTLAPVADVRVVLAPLDEGGSPIAARSQTAVTDADGRFAFVALPPGPHSLALSTVGYLFVRRRLEVTDASVLDLVVPLVEGAGTYEEHVTVTAALDDAETPLAVRSLGPAALQDLRGVVTDDPMRAVHALPGVATGDDFQAGFSVRGSPFRHAGVTIDGVPAMRLLHAVNAEANTGSVSMINTDVLARATLAVGARPAPDGDWIGPTLAFDLREGSRDRAMLRTALSGTSASVVAEGPVTRGRRGSWLVSLRKSYLDWLVRVVEPDFDSTVGFWDGHVKVVVDVTPRQTLEAFVIGGDAQYREREVSSPNALLRAGSGSTLASLQWRSASDRWWQRQRVFFLGTEFRNTGADGQELARGYTQEAGWRGDAERVLGGGWTVAGGGAWSAIRAAQTLQRFERASGGRDVRLAAVREALPTAQSGSLWVEARRSGDRNRLTIGGRGSGRSDTNGRAWLPWVVAERDVGRLTVRAAAGGSAQFADVTTAFDAGEQVRLERAASFDAGITQTMGVVEWSASGFVRRERDILRATGEDRLDAATGAHVPAAAFPSAVLRLDGRAAGIDLTVRRRAAAGVSGWASYTWSRLRMRDPATGERFDADFDQRHTLNVVWSQRLSYRSAMGLKLRVGSNMPLVGYFEPDGDGLRLSSARNRVRLPVYARLDARATRTFTVARHRLTMFFEVMNVLGRRNVGPGDPSVRASLQVTGYAERLIPRVPSAGFVVEF